MTATSKPIEDDVADGNNDRRTKRGLVVSRDPRLP